MTTINVTHCSPTFVPVHASGARTRLRLTVRGRRVVAAIAALPLACALGLAVMSGGSAIASKDLGSPAGSFATVTVSSGDTLWSIAEAVAPGADPRDVVDDIVRLNGLDGAGVMVGERLAIPADYAPRS